jgi:SAM-dependent methyltransferase
MAGPTGTPTNEVERRRWNDAAWAAVWPKREQLTGVVTDVLLGHLHLAAGDRVLDVGSGGGTTSIAAGRLVGATGCVVGADISEPLVSHARRRAAEQAATNVRFVVADVQHDEVEGAPFSVAMSQFGVMFFDEPRTAFAHILDQAEPGGRLGFACWQSFDRNPWHLGHAVEAWVAPPPPPLAGKSRTGPFSLSDSARTADLLTAAGWSAVVCTGYEMTATVAGEAIADDAQLGFLGVPEGNMAEVREAVDRHLARFDRGDGTYEAPLAFQIFTAIKQR